MALSPQEKLKIEQLKNFNRVFNDAQDGGLLAKAVQTSIGVGELSDISSTDLSAVPASFATLADVQAYLSTVISEIETRLDAAESKINEIINA